MNKYIKNSFIAGITALTITGCGENSWNDHSLDGFEGGVVYNKTVTGTYTLTSDDYEAISKLMLAKATNKADTTEAKAIANNCYFDKNGTFPASVALPPFMETASFPYYLAPSGSQADISYAECDIVPAEIAAISGADTYTLTKDDYIIAWGSNEDYIPAFAPMTPASSKLPTILKDAFDDAVAGQYAIVTYEEASENPVFVTAGDNPIVEIYSEPFNESQGAFVTYDANLPEGLTYVWSWGGANYGMKASAYANGTNYASEAWLISPEITLGGSKANFSFDQATNYFSSVDAAKNEATVWVKANGTWTQMTNVIYPEKLSWTFVNSGEIDLSAYCGSTIQIGFKFTSADKSGTWEVKNFVVNAQDGSVGSNPGYVAKPQTRALASTTDAATKNAVYFYDGSTWAPADGVVALNPADYTAMGVADAKLTSPETYIPLYLKNKLIYAQAGDQEFVLYNKNKVGLFVFDGANWSLNNNGLEDVVGRYTKSSDAWSFTKYIGKATFNEFTDDQIMLDRSYLISYGNICATPVPQGSSYGYLQATSIQVKDGVVVLPSDANAFTFSSYVMVDDTKYDAPEGKFFIVDSNGRYYYCSGTYSSTNVTDKDYTYKIVNNGEITEGYLWTAAKNADGTWKIENNRGADNTRWIVYSETHDNFAVYTSVTDVDHYPTLFLMD